MLAATMAVAAACIGESETGTEAMTTTSSGAALTMDIRGATDVGGMRFEITAVDCETGEVTGYRGVIDKKLEDIRQGEDIGAVNIASALNHPPVIETLWFVESKFVERCAAQVVCATASDPDGDPIEWVWPIPEEPPHHGPEVVSTEVNEDGTCGPLCHHVHGRHLS